jgi:hypothetical protein
MIAKTETRFALRDTVKDVLDESPLSDPRDLAAVVLARIPECEREHALLETLPDYVRNLIGTARKSNREAVADSGKVPAKGVPWFKVGGGLAKALLDERVKGADGWKRFGDCGPDDVRAIAERNESLALQNAAIAARYRSVLDALISRGASRVDDLGSDVADLMGGAR